VQPDPDDGDHKESRSLDLNGDETEVDGETRRTLEQV